MCDLISKAKYDDAIPAFEEFNERNDDCDGCPFYDEECSGDGDKRCLLADVLELLKRGHDLEMNAEPVRHGEWEDTPIGTIKCTLCGCSYNLYKGFAKYCPNCGAKMDKEAQNETN